MKTGYASLCRLYRIATIFIIAAVAFLTACTSGSINEDVASQIYFYETYTVLDLSSIFNQLNEEAAKDNPDAPTLEQLLHQQDFNQHTRMSIFSQRPDSIDNTPTVEIPDSIYDTPVVGRALAADTAAVNRIIAQFGKEILPRDVILMWSLKPIKLSDQQEAFELIALRTVNEEPIMNGEYLVKAKSKYDSKNGTIISLKFDTAGARMLYRITSQNIGRHLAFVAFNKVLSYPDVVGSVDDGYVEIPVNLTEEEAKSFIDCLYGRAQQ